MYCVYVCVVHECVHMYLHVCVSGHMCLQVHIHGCACGGQILMLNIFLDALHPICYLYVEREGFSLEHRAHRFGWSR